MGITSVQQSALEWVLRDAIDSSNERRWDLSSEAATDEWRSLRHLIDLLPAHLHNDFVVQLGSANPREDS